MKLNIGVIFGGKSVEHELSILTAIQAMEYIDKDKYQIVPIYITKDLTWYAGGMLKYIDSFRDYRLINRYAKKVNLIKKKDRFVLQTTGLFKNELTELHLIFPMVQGFNAEDGTIQGYLNLVGIPYVGSDIYTSAIGQDKVFVRQILVSNDIPVIKYVWLNDSEYKNTKEDVFKKIEKLKYPLIIKPARLGSSVGIEIVKRKEELELSIERALKFDRKIIVEEMLENVSEYNCSVLGSSDGVQISDIEEINKKEAICTYQDKYTIDSDDSANIKRIFPAQLDKKLEEEIKETALEIFKLLNARGVAQIEFLYDKKSKRLYFNEINIIPNFFSHHMWENKNIDYKELMDILIKEELNNISKKEKMTFTLEEDTFKKLTTKQIREMK